MPKSFTNRALIKPLLGLSSMTQEIETKIGGKILGMIAVSSNSRRHGASVRMVIHANDRAKSTERPEAPTPKINEFNISE